MNIIDALNNELINRGYLRVGTNSDKVYLFIRTVHDALDLVAFIYSAAPNEIIPDGYANIVRNIKSSFQQKGFQKINYLGLIFTDDPVRDKDLCFDEDEHWMINMLNDRLMIYENQASDYFGLRDTIENILYTASYEKNQMANSAYSGNYQGRQSNPAAKGFQFTLINTILIGINIIIFIAIYLTPFFDRPKEIVARGALSWYFVKEYGEYYRVLTSMFLHSDFSHLFNNMLVLLFVGGNLERMIGKVKFIMIYFGTGILAGLSSLSYNMIKGLNVYSIGASGAIFGVVGAMAYIILINKGRLKEISPRQIILFIIASLYGGITSENIDNVAHIGGFIAGVVFALILYRRRPKKVTENER